MKDLEQKTVEILDKLDALATQYAPEVVDSAIGIMQVSGASKIILGLLGLCFVCAIAFSVCKGVKYCAKKQEENREWEAGAPIIITLGVIFSVGILIASLTALLNVWNWVAMFDPKLALAQRIMGL